MEKLHFHSRASVEPLTGLHQAQALTSSTAQGRPCRANIYSVDQEMPSFVEGGSFLLR
jgi:hypothetical protein